MRVDVGPGISDLLFPQRLEVYLLLVGGAKSTQKRDIERALAMARQLKEQGHDHEYALFDASSISTATRRSPNT